jgi:F0F1-type ATP synthase membrane subunit c/vacuolar-type H+-ATPase subunit K
MVVVGAIAGWYFDRNADRRSKNPESTKQLGVLLASGMIVGEGLLGVVIAALVAFSGKDFPLALVGDAFATGPALWIGGIAFAVIMIALYRWIVRLSNESA